MRQPGDQQADRDIFNIDNKGTVTVINQPVPQRSRSETLLLQAVKQEVISRLAQSLHNAMFINLSKQAQPQQVRRSLDAEIKIGSKSPEALPAETTILQVFDRSGIDGRLLILGEPGAGKTTTMLDLAKGLCDRAEENAAAFIPVLLNLSSWKDPKQTMIAWLVEELRSKYGVRKNVGTQWLAEKQLLPLLDGLDEVKPEHQEGCVQAINRWLESEDRPPSLAVCCRREEYEKVVRCQWQVDAEEPQDETRMHLNGAILLQTLTDEQIQAYLTAANQPQLWQTLRQDKALWELIKTPLWLSITLLSYEGLSLNQWQQTTSTEQRLALLLDAYVQRMLHRELKSQAYGKQKPPTASQTRRWLVFLAEQLQRESQTEFLIEQMQPSCLQAPRQEWIYYAGLSFMFFGLLYIFLCPILIFVWISGWFVGLNSILLTLGVPLSILFFSLTTNSDESPLSGKIETVEVLRWSLTSVENTIIGLLKYPSEILNIVCRPGSRFIEKLHGFGIISVLLTLLLPSSLIIGLIFLPLSGFSSQEINSKVKANQGILNSAENALIGSFICAFSGSIACMAASVIFSWFSSSLRLNIDFAAPMQSNSFIAWIGFGVCTGGFMAWLYFGGAACIQHFVLRFVLYRSNSIPWNYARFLDYCTDRLFLQRVGGRYRFIHKYLQEHFASMRE